MPGITATHKMRDMVFDFLESELFIGGVGGRQSFPGRQIIFWIGSKYCMIDIKCML